MGWLHTIPCLVCDHPDVHAHHITYAEQSGMGLKVGDNWCVPLCATHHHELHTYGLGEKMFWIMNGIDPKERAAELWASWQNLSHSSGKKKQ